MVNPITSDRPGERVLLMGNEAIARGALEAGVQMVTGYPGTPSSEITETLLKVAAQLGIYGEWSVNEKVAVESAAGGAMAGLRSLVTMKHAGMNWALDWLSIASYQDFGGLVIVSADDPGAHSSGNEQDNRILSKFCNLPTFSPSTIQEAKDMMGHAFDISERYKVPCVLRSTTLLSHAKSGVLLGSLPKEKRIPKLDHEKVNIIFPVVERHDRLLKKIGSIRNEFERSLFNHLEGPSGGKLLIVTSGTGYLYSRDVMRLLKLSDKVGILKIGTVFPLPEELIKSIIPNFEIVLFAEEVEPYLEENIKVLAFDIEKGKIPEFRGKRSGDFHLVGELDPEEIKNNVCKIVGLESEKPKGKEGKKFETLIADVELPTRGLTFCAGCPHRATFYIAKKALKEMKKGYCLGDIGCYSLGAIPPFKLLKSFQGMGSGPGVACGLGNLGLEEPIVAFIGDSTFFHASIPAIVNMVHTKSKVTLVVMDNSVTGSTGFQPHPGTNSSGVGESAKKIDIEQVLKGLGVEDLIIIDPFFETKKNIEVFLRCFSADSLSVIISRRKCAVVEQKERRAAGESPPRYLVDPEECIGCRICLKEFSCPAMIWDPISEKVSISREVCVGCGACIPVCPANAIQMEENENSE